MLLGSTYTIFRTGKPVRPEMWSGRDVVLSDCYDVFSDHCFDGQFRQIIAHCVPKGVVLGLAEIDDWGVNMAIKLQGDFATIGHPITPF